MTGVRPFDRNYENIHECKITDVRFEGKRVDRNYHYETLEFFNDNREEEIMLSTASVDNSIGRQEIKRAVYQPSHESKDFVKIHGTNRKSWPRKPTLEKEGAIPLGTSVVNWFYRELYANIDEYLRSTPGSPGALAMASQLAADHRKPIVIGERFVRTRFAQPENVVPIDISDEDFDDDGME
jgi:hypothetical protein